MASRGLTDKNVKIKPIFSACVRGNLDIVKVFPEDFNSTNMSLVIKIKWTPLMYAYGFNQHKIVRYLLDHGAEMNLDGVNIFDHVNPGDPKNESRQMLVDEHLKYIFIVKNILKYLGLDNIFVMSRKILHRKITNEDIMSVVYT